MKFRILIILLLAGLVQAQTTHRAITSLLLKNMQQSIYDSTAIAIENQFLIFNGIASVDDYLNEIIKTNMVPESPVIDSVNIHLRSFVLTINSDPSETYRNTSYLRQLELSMDYTVQSNQYSWQDTVSDQLSKSAMSKRLDEYFPVPISGDYIEGQPPVFRVMLMTLGVLSLVAALYFIRT